MAKPLSAGGPNLATDSSVGTDQPTESHERDGGRECRARATGQSSENGDEINITEAAAED
jgi:hypothetical protein